MNSLRTPAEGKIKLTSGCFSAADDLRRRRHPESPALKAMPGSQRAAKQNILASDVLRYQGEAAIIQENASVSATVGFNVDLICPSATLSHPAKRLVQQ